MSDCVEKSNRQWAEHAVEILGDDIRFTNYSPVEPCDIVDAMIVFISSNKRNIYDLQNILLNRKRLHYVKEHEGSKRRDAGKCDDIDWFER